MKSLKPLLTPPGAPDPEQNRPSLAHPTTTLVLSPWASSVGPGALPAPALAVASVALARPISKPAIMSVIVTSPPQPHAIRVTT